MTRNESPYLLSIHHWGRAGWNFLIACALLYPLNATELHKTQFLAVFENVGHILPCEICGEHYNTFVKKNPVDINNGPTGLAKWLLTLRNEINVSHKKKRWSFAEMVNQYMPLEMAKEIGMSTDELNEMEQLPKPQVNTKIQIKKSVFTILCILIIILLAVVILLLILHFKKQKK